MFSMRSLLALFLSIPLILSAQKDSIPYTRDYEFREGIFLTVQDLKYNNPIPKEAIISSLPSSGADFLSQVMAYKYVTYKDRQGLEQKLETATVWGFCQNRSLYINFNKEFNRINVIGSLCHLVATVSTVSGVRDPMNYNYAINNTYEELRQFVVDLENNKVLDFNVKNMEAILQRDPVLHEEFMKLSRKKKADSIFIYLRKYNEKHPLYLSPG
jgi:hypothetical protein